MSGFNYHENTVWFYIEDDCIYVPTLNGEIGLRDNFRNYIQVKNPHTLVWEESLEFLREEGFEFRGSLPYKFLLTLDEEPVTIYD